MRPGQGSSDDGAVVLGVPPELSARSSRSWQTLLRFVVPVTYLGLAAAIFASNGVPLSRGWVFVWVLGGLFCVSLGALQRFWRSLLTEWLPLVAALMLYDVLRGVGAGRFPIHADFQIWLDRYIFGFASIPSVWLQQHLWDPARITWYDRTTWLVYTSYYLVTPLALAWLWLRDPPAFRRYAVRLAGLAFACVAFFTVSPTTPPWLASDKGLIGPITRLIGPVGRSIGGVNASALWERGVRLANDLAAFPSLHEGMTILVCIALWPRSGRLVRSVLVAYPLAMAFALVYTGEHYVSDLVAGGLVTVAVVGVERRVQRSGGLRGLWAAHSKRRRDRQPGAAELARSRTRLFRARRPGRASAIASVKPRTTRRTSRSRSSHVHGSWYRSAISM
jgi:membrane-associated phospholipid phosphatase